MEKSAAQKAAETRKRRAAARKAVETRRRNAAAGSKTIRTKTAGEAKNSITTTIERQWFRDIVNRLKTIEYREIKPYWELKLARVKVPFLLHLQNGMTPNPPKLTVEIVKVRRNSRSGNFELHIGRILKVENWNRKTGEPA